MIVLERFIYGLFKNSGYKEIYTSQVKKILTKESLEQLKDLQLKKSQSSDIITLHFPSEGVITRSYLQSTNDVYGRNGFINHTIIMRTADFINEFPEVLNVAFKLLDAQTSSDLSSLPKSLEPLKVETK